MDTESPARSLAPSGDLAPSRWGHGDGQPIDHKRMGFGGEDGLPGRHGTVRLEDR